MKVALVFLAILVATNTLSADLVVGQKVQLLDGFGRPHNLLRIESPRKDWPGVRLSEINFLTWEPEKTYYWRPWYREEDLEALVPLDPEEEAQIFKNAVDLTPDLSKYVYPAADRYYFSVIPERPGPLQGYFPTQFACIAAAPKEKEFHFIFYRKIPGHEKDRLYPQFGDAWKNALTECEKYHNSCRVIQCFQAS